MAIDHGLVNRSGSLLGYRHFQNAYVTNDLERAMAIFRDAHGVGEFRVARDFPITPLTSADVAIVWLGNLMFELIEGHGDPASLFERQVQGPDFALRFHHTGYLIPDQRGWDELCQRIEAAGRTIATSGDIPDFISWIYIEMPELGHYVEYACPKAAGIEMFDQTPRY